MRRPDPLPVPPPGRDDARRRSETSGGPAGSQADAAAPLRRLPGMPSPDGSPGDAAGAVPAGDPSGAASSEDPRRSASRDVRDSGPPRGAAPAAAASDDPEPVGVRGVWRAARARRRALQAEVRRFTARRRRRRWTWAIAIGSVLVVGLGSVAAAHSPLFGVETITVTGTSALDPAAVGQALASQRGTPLASVDESAVKAALVGFPLVESYRLEARPPHELVVRIVERTPVGAIAVPGGFSVVDAAGVVLSTSPSLPAGVAEITVPGGTGGPVFAAVARVVRALPDDVRTRLATVSATTPNDVTLTLAGRGARIVWGSADDSARKAVVLATAMAARPADTVQEYDVSTPAAVVVR